MPASELEKEQRVSADLKANIEDLEGEVRVLKTQLGDTEHLKSAYNSDKQAFSQHAQGLKEANDTLREEHERIKARLHLVEKERGILTNDVEFYKERLSTLERNYEANKEVIERLNSEKAEETTGQSHLREQIKGLENSLAQTVRERDEIRHEADRVK